MNTIDVTSTFQTSHEGQLPEASQLQIKTEPMLFNCDFSHARSMGGILTEAFLKSLPSSWKRDETVVDSRVHMLMPGWYPCIPGWHHDDVIRNREDGQPNYLQNEYASEHIMALWNADICPTEFATGSAPFIIPPIGKTIYEVWHPVVNQKIKDGALKTVDALDRTLIHFDDRTWHRGTPARKNGFRFFIRASRYTKNGKLSTRGNSRTNEIRKQSQIYMSAENAGW